jgi:hypothetical protein
MAMAPFKELDFLRPPRPVTLYEPYPSLLPPNFDYQPQTLTPKITKEPGVIPEDNWLCNITRLLPMHPYTILRLGGRMVEAPFYKYDFLPDYPKILLLQEYNCP